VDYRIRRFGIASTALTVAVIYFVLGLIIAPLFFLATLGTRPNDSLPGILFLLAPFIYAVFGYVFAAIGCFVYNVIAGWTGGVALTLEPGEAK
jgi:uncharacterized protein YacL